MIRSAAMQTERVTYLTSAEHKAQLEAFAKARGESVGHVVREATTRYMAQPRDRKDEEAMLEKLADELERLIPGWNARFDNMEANLDRAHRSVRESLARAEAALR
jgi:hypothetical protein